MKIITNNPIQFCAAKKTLFPKYKKSPTKLFAPPPGLLSEKRTGGYLDNNTWFCLCIQNIFPFKSTKRKTVENFIEQNTYKSRSYVPSETGGYFLIDNNIMLPHEKLGITESQYNRYCKITPDEVEANKPTVIRVEIALKKAGLDHLIRFHIVK